MATAPISQLPLADEILTGGELTVIVQGGVTKSISLSHLKTIVTKADVGLSRADNTPDLDKPISRNQQTALNGKANKAHTHPQDEVNGLIDSLAAKANRAHGHDVTDVTGLRGALDAKAPLAHPHTTANITDFNQAVALILNDAKVDLSGVLRVGNLDW